MLLFNEAMDQKLQEILALMHLINAKKKYVCLLSLHKIIAKGELRNKFVFCFSISWTRNWKSADVTFNRKRKSVSACKIQIISNHNHSL